MIPVISYAKGTFGKHLKNRQIPYQSVRGPWLTFVFQLIHVHYKKNGYNMNVLQQTACLVVNPIKIQNLLELPYFLANKKIWQLKQVL